jgi:hypothetical protein
VQKYLGGLAKLAELIVIATTFEVLPMDFTELSLPWASVNFSSPNSPFGKYCDENKEE